MVHIFYVARKILYHWKATTASQRYRNFLSRIAGDAAFTWSGNVGKNVILLL
jgi:hypothetical protein